MASKTPSTYAPVCKATMKELALPAGLSWKRGFLQSKSKGNTGTQALPQVQAKRILKIQCPHVKNPGNKFQQNFPMGGAVSLDNNPAMATNQAPLSLQNVTLATVPTLGTCEKTCQHDPTMANTTGLGTTPQLLLNMTTATFTMPHPSAGCPPE